MQSARIHDLLRLGPNERIIFVSDASRPAAIAQCIAGLANAQGGTLVLGVKGRGAIVGVRDAQAAMVAIDTAARRIMPELLLEPQMIELDGNMILALDVPRGVDTPYVADGRIVVWNGRRLVAANGVQAAELAQRAVNSAALIPLTQRLQSKSAAPAIDLEHILLKLERLIIANAELTHKLDQANSWHSRITDQAIGAVLGLIISTIVLYVLGLG